MRISIVVGLDHGFIINRNNVICGVNDVCMAGNHLGPIHISAQIVAHWQLIWRILGEKGIKLGLSRGDKQGYWLHCHIAFHEWCISGAIYQNGHWAWANDTITKHRSLLQKSHSKYFQHSPERCQSQQSHSGNGHTLPTWGSDLWGTSA